MTQYLIIAVLAGILCWALIKTVRRAKRGSACCGERDRSPRRVRPRRAPADYRYACTLDIEGMTCENCAVRVENALNALPGVWARVDLASKRAAVRSASPCDAQVLCLAVVRAGYGAVLREDGRSGQK